jgi:hypothetical protein
MGGRKYLPGLCGVGEFIGSCGGENNGKKLGGGKQAAATSGSEAYRAS